MEYADMKRSKNILARGVASLKKKNTHNAAERSQWVGEKLKFTLYLFYND